MPRLLLVAWLLAPGVASAASMRAIAVLPVELLKADYLPEPHRVTADEQARLDMVATLVRERLAREGWRVASADSTRSAVRETAPDAWLHECNGCERDIGAALDADWVLVGWIQIVSNLIVNLNVVVYDVVSGRRVAQAFVDLRGNTERSWRRATRYMLDRILVERLHAAR